MNYFGIFGRRRVTSTVPTDEDAALANLDIQADEGNRACKHVANQC